MSAGFLIIICASGRGVPGLVYTGAFITCCGIFPAIPADIAWTRWTDDYHTQELTADVTSNSDGIHVLSVTGRSLIPFRARPRAYPYRRGPDSHFDSQNQACKNQ